MNHNYLILYNPASCNGKSSKIVAKLKSDFDKLFKKATLEKFVIAI